jgi:PhzF family phenazine biosynthesis protein
MKIPIFIVDAFTDKQFKGNPAAVCLLNEKISDSIMQNIAFEMNLSETAFLLKNKNGFNLRWFTPSIEVDLCGHATLASSHVIKEFTDWNIGNSVEFYTKSGKLIASYVDEMIQLDFPLLPEHEVQPHPDIEKAVGTKPVYVGLSKNVYFVQVENEKLVREMSPDFELLESLPAWGIVVTAKSDTTGYDFVSRFFAPEKGVKEDPVTGSVHCTLAPFWGKQLNKNEFVAYQASQRGGVLNVKIKNERVLLLGNAVTVLKGELILK